MKQISIKKTLAAGAACLLAAVSFPKAGQPYLFIDYNSSTNTGWKTGTYIDFGATSAISQLHKFTANFTPNAGSVDARFYEIPWYSVNTAGQCFEIHTGMATNVPTDPKLWVRVGSGFQGLSDDFSGLFPAARVWLKGGAPPNSVTTFMYLAAYNSGYNGQDLYLDITRLEGVGEASCTTAQPQAVKFPWVKYIGESVTTGLYK